MPTCSKCGLGYSDESPEDVLNHESYHDKMVYGLRTPKLKSENVLWEDDSDRITLITPFSKLAQCERAEGVIGVSRRDDGFDFAPFAAGESPDWRQVHVLLFHRDARGVAFIVIERGTQVWKCTWPEYDRHEFYEVRDQGYQWTISRVWVLKQHRRQGIGRRLIAQAASAIQTDPSQIGWFTPFTEDGEALARSLQPQGIYIVK